MKPFSKLKKSIENLFVPELKMEFYCNSFLYRKGRGSQAIPRFYVKLGKRIIWDCPKEFNIPQDIIYGWADDNGICQIVRDYIDTPVSHLLYYQFPNDCWGIIQNYHLENRIEVINVDYKLTQIFKAADRRLGALKLHQWAGKLENPIVDLIIEKRMRLEDI